MVPGPSQNFNAAAAATVRQLGDVGGDPPRLVAGEELRAEIAKRVAILRDRRVIDLEALPRQSQRPAPDFRQPHQ
jgi:hypothetical protein